MIGFKKEVIGIDLGGTNLRVALVKGNKILKYIKKKTPKKRDLLIKELLDSISQLMNKNVKGIGISSPGPLKDGIIKNSPNLPLHNYNLKEKVRKTFNIKTEVENDANCVAIAEAELGCRKKNFVVLTLGTGIGGGVIINGGLYIGEGYAAEPGHILLNNGKDFEELWQENRRLFKKHFGDKYLLNDLLKMKNRKARKIVRDASVCLGQGIASLINVFDPEVVILSGGIKETGDKFLNMISEQAKKYVIFPRVPKIQWTKLEHPGVLGAGLLLK